MTLWHFNNIYASSYVKVKKQRDNLFLKIEKFNNTQKPKAFHWENMNIQKHQSLDICTKTLDDYPRKRG